MSDEHRVNRAVSKAADLSCVLTALLLRQEVAGKECGVGSGDIWHSISYQGVHDIAVFSKPGDIHL